MIKTGSADSRDGLMATTSDTPSVALFVTCLVDLFRPSVAFAAVRLLEAAGCRVEVPQAQSCCGQPAFNSGDRRTARKLASQLLDAFAGYDHVVAPSGSCIGMWRQFPDLFAKNDPRHQQALQRQQSCHELSQFLVEVRGYRPPPLATALTATYHDACAGLRELGIQSQPRQLLADRGISLIEMPTRDICCGFGGTFCNKFDAISNRMVTHKVEAVVASAAPLLLAGDLGCLLNIAGKMSRDGVQVECRHFAEVVADQLDEPAIGRPQE